MRVTIARSCESQFWLNIRPAALALGLCCSRHTFVADWLEGCEAITRTLKYLAKLPLLSIKTKKPHVGCHELAGRCLVSHISPCTGSTVLYFCTRQKLDFLSFIAGIANNTYCHWNNFLACVEARIQCFCGFSLLTIHSDYPGVSSRIIFGQLHERKLADMTMNWQMFLCLYYMAHALRG